MISCLGFLSIGLIPEPSEWYYPRYSHSGQRGTPGRYFKYQNLSKYNRERKGRTKWNTTHSSGFFQEEVSHSVEDLQKCEEKEEVTNQEEKTEGERFVGTREWNDRVPELNSSYKGEQENQKRKSRTKQKWNLWRTGQKELMSEKERWGRVDEKKTKKIKRLLVHSRLNLVETTVRSVVPLTNRC